MIGLCYDTHSFAKSFFCQGSANPVSYHALQFIVGTALTDSEFRQQLLANPDKAVTDSDLTGAERVAVAVIKADRLEDFACQLDQWIIEQEDVPQSHPPRSLSADLPPTPWPATCLLSVR